MLNSDLLMRNCQHLQHLPTLQVELKLQLNTQGQSEALDDWLDAIICCYFYNNSWAEIKNTTRTEMDAKFDVKCGLAALHVRYGVIEFNSN